MDKVSIAEECYVTRKPSSNKRVCTKLTRRSKLLILSQESSEKLGDIRNLEILGGVGTLA